MNDATLEARQIQVLREWLEKPVLSVHEAACLLAGVLPPERLGDQRDFGAWLPGREAWEHARAAWNAKVKSEIALIETIIRDAGVPLGQSPGAYLALGRELGFIPPWFDAAYADPECREFLAPKAMNASGEIEAAPKEKTARQIAASANANKRWAADDTRQMILGTGWQAFQTLRTGGFEEIERHESGRWAGHLNINDLGRAVLEAIRDAAPDEADIWPDPQSVKRMVKKWLMSEK